MSATFVLNLKADPSGIRSGTKQVERDLDKIKSKALDVNRSIRQVFGIFAIRELMGGLYGLVDGYTSLSNKLNVVAKDQRNLNGLMDATFKIAQETRSSWASTGQMFSRMAMNSKQLGASQQDLLDFTKSLNQAIIIGGATATEASAGLLQLSQGMASGALKGDELRAVLEQLPIVADVIGKKLGVTRGELRKMGTDGKITGKVILEAFRDSAKELEEKFGKTVPTIGQSFEMLRNAAMKFFGEAGTGSGVLGTLSAAIKFLADNMDTLGKIAIAVGQSLLGLMILRTIQQLVVALFTVIAAHPLMALILAITTLITLLRQFGDQLDAGHDSVVKISDVFRIMWEDIKQLGAAIYEFLGLAWKDLTQAFNTGLETDGIEFSLKSVLMFIASFVDVGIGLFRFLKNSIVTVFGGVPATIAEGFIDAFKHVLNAVEFLVNGIIKGLNAVLNAVDDIKSLQPGYTPAKGHWDKQALAAQKWVGEMNAKFNPGGGFGVGVTDVQMSQLDEEWKKAGMKGPRRQLGTADAPGGPGRMIPAHEIGEVDLSFENPFAGAAAAADAKFVEDYREIMKTSFAKDYVADLFNRTTAADANKIPGDVSRTVLTDPSKYQAPKPGRDKEHEKMLRELDRLLKKSNEIRKAEMEMAAAEKFLARGDVLAELSKRGITAATVLSDLRAELAAALYPLEDWTNKQLESAAIMRGTNEEYERNKTVLEAMNELYDKGLIITDDVVKQIERVTVATQERAKMWELEKGILESVNGAQIKYRDNLKALNNLQVEGRITALQYAAAFKQITAEYTASNDAAYEAWQAKWAKNNPFGAGWADASNKIQEDMLGVSSAVSDALTNAFGNLESFILTTVDTGKLAWDELTEGILQSLDKVALKILEQWLLMQALGMMSGGGGGAKLPFIDSSYAMPGVTQADWAASDDVLGYASGGSGKIAGSGPPDSQLFMARVTPGEHFTFTPPGQGDSLASSIASAVTSAMARNGSGGGQVVQKTQVVNSIDRSELLSAVETPQGERVIMNVIRKNPGAIKSLLQK